MAMYGDRPLMAAAARTPFVVFMGSGERYLNMLWTPRTPKTLRTPPESINA